MHLQSEILRGGTTKSTMTAFTALNGGDSRAPGAHKGSPPSHSETDEQRSSARADGSFSRHSQGSPESRHGQYVYTRETEVDSPAKRKRSMSPESARHAEEYRRSDGRAESRTVHFASAERQEGPRDDDRGRYQQSWSTRDVDDQRGRDERYNDTATNSHTRHDERDRDVSQEGDSMHADDHDYPVSSPEDDDNMMSFGDNDKGDQARADGSGHSSQSKRKRNFSHRTKTGCFTCRRRKKKCDEQKPECMISTNHGPCNINAAVLLTCPRQQLLPRRFPLYRIPPEWRSRPQDRGEACDRPARIKGSVLCPARRIRHAATSASDIPTTSAGEAELVTGIPWPDYSD